MELLKQSFDYDSKALLGRGAFANVYRGTRLSDQCSVAVKFMEKPRSSSRDYQEKIETMRRELNIMQSLDHPDVVELLGKFEDTASCIIVQELVPGGELFDYLTEKETLEEIVAMEFIKQLLGVLHYLHATLRVMHLDIKPENLLLNADHTKLKLIDFGLAHHYDPSKPLKKMIGTPEFLSPEICSFDAITPVTDIWAMGVLTYIMLTGYSPYLGDDDQETIGNVSQNEPPDFDDEEITTALSEDSLDFLKYCLQPSVRKRPTAEQCLGHSWFRPPEDGQVRPSVSLSTKKLRETAAKRRFRDAARAIRFANRMSRLSHSLLSPTSPTTTRSESDCLPA
eukprot:scpid79881/ scgid13539/ Death-associated protein kinase 3; DAP-like kinase; MYPT1 kinase; Zipper-interacting protein kinase